VVPPFHLGMLAILYKNIRRTRFAYHIQDMQIEAARDLQMIKSPKLLKMLFRLEKMILNKADVVSSISSGMIRKIEEKAGKPVAFFPNWADVSSIYPLNDRTALKTFFGFAANDKIVLYSGAIGEKQGLEIILDVAAEITDPNIKFLICGSGPYKAKLQEMAEERQLSNIIFFPLQPKDKFNQFLNMADVHLVLQKADASDLVMPSKLTNILASGGLALITAGAGSSLYDEVDRHDMGIVVKPEDKQALKNGINTALGSDKQYLRINARLYAEEYLSIDKIIPAYMNIVLKPDQHQQ
jgi:colanic acid biosynthesis glycosyl transferase WcaI